jgi:hypothetical protein
MFHSLLILLHRPFVSEGHLKSVAKSAASRAFAICETAALEIDVLLRLYKSQWCIKSPPYFVSYATYVSATIHARTAAQNLPGSRAHQSLRNCLEILSEHQTVCHAPRRSMSILLELVRRLKVDVGAVFTASVSRTAVCDTSNSEMQEATSFPKSSSSLTLKSSSGVFSGQGHVSEMGGPSRRLDPTEGDPMQLPNTRIESDNTVITPLHRDLFGQIGSEGYPPTQGLDGLLPDMFFDFDPLFGFNDFEMNFEPDVGY